MKKGFTLIELLVVITIMGILASMTLIMVGGAKSEAKDARRKTDLVQIMTAIELYRSLEGQFPSVGTCGNSGIIANNGEICGGSIFKSASQTLLQRLPQDPSGLNYAYSYSGIYIVTANLENGNSFICSNTSCYEE